MSVSFIASVLARKLVVIVRAITSNRSDRRVASYSTVSATPRGRVDSAAVFIKRVGCFGKQSIGWEAGCKLPVLRRAQHLASD